MGQPTIPKLLTEAEAAEILRLSPRTLRSLRSKGLIRYVCPTGNRIRYREDDIAEYIEQQTVDARPVTPTAPAPKAVSRSKAPKLIGFTEMMEARRQAKAAKKEAKS